MKPVQTLFPIFSLLAVIICPPRAEGSFVLTTLFSFESTNGANPSAALLQAQDGSFYGTTISGGPLNLGTIFKLSPDGSFTNLFSFRSTNGANPRSALVQGPPGDPFLYGITSNGGISNLGTIFKISTNGSHSALLSFEGTNGANPQSALIFALDAGFYGTTYYGGTNSWPNAYGTVFRFSTNGVFSRLCSFNNSNGAEPFGGLLQTSDGNFYGTTQVGGDSGYGCIFKVTSTGALTNLVSFHGTNGSFPLSGLIRGNDGLLYGTTYSGGPSNLGTIFSVTTNGVIHTLFTFRGTNGAAPYGGLVQAADGNLYGTTEQGYGPGGDTNGYGTVFQITTNGALTTLISFNSTNGAYPLASLLQAADGSFYGTTANGGLDGYGTIFRLSVPASSPPVFQNITQTGSALSLIWSAVSGRTYQVQFKTNLAQTAWSNLGAIITATNVTASLTASNGPDPQRFYRAVLLP
jgi:uncharacterized repeat protein (TIGR03803 family)